MLEESNPLEALARQMGFSRFELAQMLDATPGVVDAWITGVMPPGPRSRERLEGLVAVFEGLLAKLTPPAAQTWLSSPNAALDYYEPVDFLRRGDFDSVARVIERMQRSIRLDRNSPILH